MHARPPLRGAEAKGLKVSLTLVPDPLGRGRSSRVGRPLYPVPHLGKFSGLLSKGRGPLKERESRGSGSCKCFHHVTSKVGGLGSS